MTPPRERPAGHVWVDGVIHPADGRHLSVFDRGFQLGDGIFETLRARGGAPAELDAHLRRLHRSAAGLDHRASAGRRRRSSPKASRRC